MVLYYQCLMRVMKRGERTLITCNRRFLSEKSLAAHQKRWH
jgi:hypothetical protein